MELHFYNDTLQPLIAAYELTEEQLYFTGSPQEAIKMAKGDSARHPIAALHHDKAVCFFVLHEKEGVAEYSNNSHAILLRTFSTAYTHLRKGYAKQVLVLLPTFVHKHFPNINEIVLAVNAANDVAEQLYEKCGYQDTGLRRPGRNGELTVMSYKMWNN